MKTIGLLGGMSWESTREYYRLFNEGVRDAKGGLHSAKLLMHSFDFAEIAQRQHAGEWDALADMLVNAAKGLEAAGADALMICTNLMHKFAPHIQKECDIPLIHIGDAVADAIKANGQSKVALLGAKFTMAEPFYKDRLAQQDIETIIPEGEDFDEISRIIYEELCQGEILDASRNSYLMIIAKLAEQGAEGIVLGCTEIPLLIQQDMCNVSLYDTTAIHVRAGLDFMLDGSAKNSLKAAS
ncbi:MAG: aspartate/glutamate racemase family protein [Rickettsiales bacterium]|nr:aspartate/glutamate racemase family protein [Rickettsiales bacterium]